MVWGSDTCRCRCNSNGNEVNVQDLACIHQTEGKPVVIEDGASIGHSAVVHGATIRKNGSRWNECNGAR